MARVLVPFLFCAFLLLGGREPPWGDANVTYVTTKTLWESHRLDIELDAPPYFFTVRGGKKYGIAPLGNVVAMLPSYLIHKRLMGIPKIPEQPVGALATHFVPALLMAAAAALFYRLARRRGASPRLALLLTATLSFGTMCFIYARVAYAEALQTFALLLLVERTIAQGERLTLPGMAALGLAAGVLLNSKIVYAVLLPVCAAYLLWAHLRDPARRDLKRLGAACGVALLSFLPFLVLAVWHNWLKTGTLFRSGHEGQADFFGGDLGAALYGFLLSPGKSLFLFSPPLLLGVIGLAAAWRRRRAETLLLLGVCLVALLVHAKFRIWHGGYCWGPRYLVPLTPLLLLLALPWLPEALGRGRVRLRRAAVGALLGAGLLVQLLGAAFYWDHYTRILVAVRDQTGMARWSEDHLAHGYFVPEFSPVLGHYWLFKHWLRKDPDLNRDAPWKGLIRGRLRLNDNWHALRIDFWGVDWLKGRREVVTVGMTTLGILAVGLAASGWGIRRRLRREEREDAL
ncbi:MAG: glycosyltransferase family 39 protein [Deltaproteobacteria bacterium]|nr:glycosyltransferase family 39 protein [Deltaproteobacteria bacterium]